MAEDTYYVNVEAREGLDRMAPILDAASYPRNGKRTSRVAFFSKTIMKAPLTRSPVSSRFSVVLLVVVVASGCLEANESPLAPRPRLTDFLACEYAYPDGRAVPCENQARQLEAKAGSAPQGWVCVATFPDTPPRWAWYRRTEASVVGVAPPVWTQDFGLVVEFDDGTQHYSGALKVWSESREYFYSVEDGGIQFFLQFPEPFDDAIEFHADFLGWNAFTNTSVLQAARVEHSWSDYGQDRDGAYWVLTRFVTPNGTYTFNQMRDLGSWVPADASWKGVDFDLQLSNEAVLRGGSGSLDATLPASDCP